MTAAVTEAFDAGSKPNGNHRMPQRAPRQLQLPLLPPDAGPALATRPPAGRRGSAWAGWLESTSVILAVVAFGLLWATLEVRYADDPSAPAVSGSDGAAALSWPHPAGGPNQRTDDMTGEEAARHGLLQSAADGRDMADRRLQRSARWPAAS